METAVYVYNFSQHRKSVESSDLVLLKQSPDITNSIEHSSQEKKSKLKPNKPVKLEQLKISDSNLLKFQRFKQILQLAKSLSKSRQLSYSFLMNYNQSPKDAIKIFQNIRHEQTKLGYNLNTPSFNIQPQVDYDYFHNMEIFKYIREQQKQLPLALRNYGIRFDSPKFVYFERPSRRLRDKIFVKSKRVDISVTKNKSISQKMSKLRSIIGKRAFEKFSETLTTSNKLFTREGLLNFYSEQSGSQRTRSISNGSAC